jgi:hypothetical protein
MIKKITLAVALALSSQAYAATGPSSSATPYVTPTAAGWDVTSILTVGDSIGGYKMVGIPDGLGAYDNGDNTFTLLMNHELGATAGVTRAHGSAGAFVSQWTINKTTLAVTAGRDMIQSPSSVNTWNTTTSAWQTGTTAFARLCSADLPAASAFYNSSTGKGYNGRIFMNGEETGAEGRGFAWVATGSAAGTVYETPYLGKFSWENSLANPYSGDKTVVIGTDDSTPGQVYMYVGNKQTTGNAVEQAGLHNGNLYGIKTSVATETGAINGAFTMQQVNALQTGANLNTQSNTAGITNFARPEDGHWADADTFYFVTTGTTAGGSAKLYRTDFTDANDLTQGGTITMVQDSASLIGTDGQPARSFDNLTCDSNGCIIQEDPGNNAYIAKTWSYDAATGTFTQILESDRSRFITGAPGFLTLDEESSGIIDVTSILGRNDGKKYYLGDMQAHYGIAGELVEGGQLYLVSQTAPVPEADSYAMLLAGLGLMGAVNRRRNNKK